MNDSDIVRRTDIINRLLDRAKPLRGFIHVDEVIRTINVAPSVNLQEPSDISNDGTLTVNVEDGRKISRVLVCGANHWGGLYYPDEQEPKTGQFAKWVATEIFDDMWEYNKDAFAEIACRKLAKLGIVRANGDEWELVEPQESEEHA